MKRHLGVTGCLVGAGLAAVLLSACSGSVGMAGQGKSSVPSHAVTSAPAAAESGAVADSSSAYESRGSDIAPQPEQRPGLGTVFGERVDSHVETKPFVRASESPFAAVMLHYNDAEGVAAQANYLGANALSPIRAYTPNGGVSIALTDEYGRLLPGGTANGRTLIVGREGQRYDIVLENRSGGRFEVVASVDGLDVIDGRPADLAKRGYIIEPYGTLVIDGFRTSESTVAAFRFGAVSDSYAARTSGDRNVGVIGVAMFAERGSVWTNDELRRRDTANPFPGDRSYARPPGW